jgi:hypothetical protein
MKTSSELIRAEIGDLQRIVKTAYEMESALGGKSIDPHDTSVQVRAAEMILRGAGARMRAIAEKSVEWRPLDEGNVLMNEMQTASGEGCD